MADHVIVPWIEFLVEIVKNRMPLQEIRDVLGEKHAAVIEKAIDLDQFLNAEFEVNVLAGQKLMAREGIQQLIPLFLQIVQQPQLLEYLHQRGETVDFKVMMDLMMQVSQVEQSASIFRALTPQEKQQIAADQPRNTARARTGCSGEKVKAKTSNRKSRPRDRWTCRTRRPRL